MAADDARVLYSCQSTDHLARSVCFPGDKAPNPVNVGTELTVGGRLQVRFHDSWTVAGQIIPANFELRLIDAEVIHK
jgi:hypothetical protein